MRDDPTGKRALFESHSGTLGEPDGKDALYEHGDVAIDCSRCGRTTLIAWSDAIRRVLGLSLWVPGMAYSRRLRCPACDRRSWVRLRLV